jgi:hypothetical protein
MVILHFTFWGITKLLSRASAPLYIPTSNVSGYQFLDLLNKTYFLFCFIVILMGEQWYLITLICISLMTNDIKHLISVCLLANCITSLEICLLKFFILGTRHKIYLQIIYPPLYMLSLYFLDNVLWYTNISNVKEVQFICFLFCCCASRSFTPCFYFKIFIVLALVFRSFTHFELTLSFCCLFLFFLNASEGFKLLWNPSDQLVTCPAMHNRMWLCSSLLFFFF